MIEHVRRALLRALLAIVDINDHNFGVLVAQSLQGLGDLLSFGVCWIIGAALSVECCQTQVGHISNQYEHGLYIFLHQVEDFGSVLNHAAVGTSTTPHLVAQ